MTPYDFAARGVARDGSFCWAKDGVLFCFSAIKHGIYKFLLPKESGWNGVRYSHGSILVSCSNTSRHLSLRKSIGSLHETGGSLMRVDEGDFCSESPPVSTPTGWAMFTEHNGLQAIEEFNVKPVLDTLPFPIETIDICSKWIQGKPTFYRKCPALQK